MNSRDLIKAFEEGKKGKSGNYASDGKALTLFNNRIAEHRQDGIYFTLAGWNTNTTKKAVNWLEGVQVHTKRGKLYNGENEISKNEWYLASRCSSELEAVQVHTKKESKN